VLDGAHNPAGTAVLADALEESFVVDGTRRLVIGMLRGRDPRQLLEPLAAVHVDVVYCCAPPTPRALPATEVARAAQSLGMEAVVDDDPARCVDAALEEARDDDLVVVTGSFYVVGEVRGHLLGLGPHRG
jgi:dihydrofolate synthase/folylpolyglutamate synthase